MRLIGDFKNAVKRSHRLYPLAHKLRRWQQDRQIQGEQRECEAKARRLGIPLEEEPAELVFPRLTSRLAARGISWPPQPSGRPLHIVYSSLPSNWERHNIPPQLAKLGDITCYFLDEQGIGLNGSWAATRAQVDRSLPEFVGRLHAQHPVDIWLSYLSGAQISPETVTGIGEMGIPCFSFHWDDRLSFYGVKYGGQWSGPAAVCRAYDLNLTNARASLVKYRVERANALFWPLGANPEFFRPLDQPFQYDVTFCGQRYGERPLLIDYLRRNGIRVDCFGAGWEHGYQSDEALVRVFNQSRVNLGFGCVASSTDQCLKGRDFEIPACGAVYLTSFNEDLPRVYRVGEEIETYESFDDCLQKIRALLASPKRCEELRQRARAAVVTRHTWAERVRELLDCRGLPAP